MQIDQNEIMMAEVKLSRSEEPGKAQKCYKMRREFLDSIKACGDDHCPCTDHCPHHGKCWECVMIHRGNDDHVPYCFRGMLNRRIDGLQRLTEGTIVDTIRLETEYKYADCSASPE